MKDDKERVIVECYVRYGPNLHSCDIFLDIDKVLLISKDPVRVPIPAEPTPDRMYLVVLRSGSEFFIPERGYQDLTKRLKEFHKTDARIANE
jgi:hypothetical protein